MGYKVMILGKSYDLPARTLAVDDKIDEIGSLDRAYRAGEITRRDSCPLHGSQSGSSHRPWYRPAQPWQSRW